MAFENIDCVKPAAASKPKVAPHGVAVCSRAIGIPAAKGGGTRRYIRITIGPQLARAISLAAPEHRLRVLFGKAEDAGKVLLSVDNETGKFLAKRQKTGAYVLTINALTAAGRFALDFPAFGEERCEAIRPTNGQPPHFVFKASKPMLAADGD